MVFFKWITYKQGEGEGGVKLTSRIPASTNSWVMKLFSETGTPGRRLGLLGKITFDHGYVGYEVPLT